MKSLLHLLLWGLLLTGCSKMPAQVAGTVTFDGKPLERGNIVFHPVAEGAIGFGTIGPGGKFTVQTGDTAGIEPGEYFVTVAATGDPPPSAPEQAELPPPLITPAKYNNKEMSGLKFTVKPGSNNVPIAISSQ